jgi:hypothetical protein
VPNTQRGIATQPYDTAELLVELEEQGRSQPRYFAVRACVTSGSNVNESAACSGGLGCRDFTRCSAPADSTAVELSKEEGAARFHANLLSHCGGWQVKKWSFFAIYI